MFSTLLMLFTLSGVAQAEIVDSSSLSPSRVRVTVGKSENFEGAISSIYRLEISFKSSSGKLSTLSKMCVSKEACDDQKVLIQRALADNKKLIINHDDEALGDVAIYGSKPQLAAKDFPLGGLESGALVQIDVPAVVTGVPNHGCLFLERSAFDNALQSVTKLSPYHFFPETGRNIQIPGGRTFVVKRSQILSEPSHCTEKFVFLEFKDSLIGGVFCNAGGGSVEDFANNYGGGIVFYPAPDQIADLK